MTSHSQRRSGQDAKAKANKAFVQATLDLAMSEIYIDPERVSPLVAYRDGTMSYAEACEAMRKRHADDLGADKDR